MGMTDAILTTSFGPITRTDLVRYAGAGGDFNPIHHDDTFAATAGYPSVFAHGLFTAGLAGAALAGVVGPVDLRRYSVRYVGQVWPGDVITVTVSEGEQIDGARIFSIDVRAAAGSEPPRLVLTGAAVARS